MLHGAAAAVVGFVAAMTVFYPFGRLFDPTIGGDEPTTLAADLMLGFGGGVFLSPLPAAIGGVIGWRLGDRRLGPALALGIIGLSALIGVALWAALGGVADDASGWPFPAALGVLAGVVAVGAHQAIGRWILPVVARRV